MYGQFRSRVIRVALALGLEPADAEDLVQVVLGVRLPVAIHTLREFRGTDPFGAWLDRLARNAAQDLRRRRRRRMTLEREAEDVFLAVVSYRQEVRAYALRRSRGDPGTPLADCRITD